MKGEQLQNFVAHRFSPPAPPRKSGNESSLSSPGSPRPSAPTISEPRTSSRRLNPYFVEWLMGWPHHWTSTTVRPGCGRAETESWRRRLAVHLSCLLDEPASSEEAA